MGMLTHANYNNHICEQIINKPDTNTQFNMLTVFTIVFYKYWSRYTEYMTRNNYPSIT